MEIINPDKGYRQEDYHMHSFSFSDGEATIEEIVQYAGKIGLAKITITDHSQAMLDSYKYAKKSNRNILKRWKNVHNAVNVNFGIEGDILDEEGSICSDIDGLESDFLILSAHKKIYQSKPAGITSAYLKAMTRHTNKINFIGHLCMTDFAEHLDLRAVVETANRYHIPFEFNCANLVNKKTDLNLLRTMLQSAERIYVNSDAHTLHELGTGRRAGFDWLRQEGFLK